MTKVIKLEPRHIKKAKEALEVLADLPDEEVDNITRYIGGQILEEIRLGLEGELEYDEAPFFAAVDQMYEDGTPKGCYLCDRDIDGNAEPFNYPEKTKLCLTCMEKVANILKAFGIDPRCLFPGLAERKHQPVIYEEYPKVVELLKPSDS